MNKRKEILNKLDELIKNPNKIKLISCPFKDRILIVNEYVECFEVLIKRKKLIYSEPPTTSSSSFLEEEDIEIEIPVELIEKLKHFQNQE